MRKAQADIAAGREILIPSVVALRIVDGEPALRVVREWRGWELTALAREIGMDPAALMNIEAGEERASNDKYAQLAAALNVPVELLDDT